MERKQAMQIAKVWNERFNDESKTYKVRAEVEKVNKGYYHVKLLPDGGSRSFHYIEALVDFERAFYVSGFVTLSYDSTEPQLIGVLF